MSPGTVLFSLEHTYNQAWQVLPLSCVILTIITGRQGLCSPTRAGGGDPPSSRLSGTLTWSFVASCGLCHKLVVSCVMFGHAASLARQL